MTTREQLIEDFADHKLATGEKFVRLINSMKAVQEPVTDPAASGTSLSFIDSIKQDKDGKITATKKTLDLANAHELNPFKGWYETGDTLPTDGFDGAYLYFKDTSELTGQTTIYRWNGTAYTDTGTVVDTSNVQTFKTGQALNGVAIDDTSLASPAPNALAKAVDVAVIKSSLSEETEVGFTGPVILGIDASNNVLTHISANKKCWYIPVTQGDVVKAVVTIGSEKAVYWAFCESEPAEGVSIVGLKSNAGTELEITEVAPVTGWFVVNHTTQNVSSTHHFYRIIMDVPDKIKKSLNDTGYFFSKDEDITAVVESLPVKGKRIGEAGNWTNSTNGSHVVFPSSEIGLITITPGENAARVAFLKTYTTPVSGNTPDYAGSGRYVDVSEMSTIKVPSGTNYIVFNKIFDGVNQFPVSVAVTGKSVFVEDIAPIEANVAHLKRDVYGEITVQEKEDVEISEMPRIFGYLQLNRFFGNSDRCAYSEIPSGWNSVYVLGGTSDGKIFFTKTPLPDSTTTIIREATLEKTYFATGNRSTSVFVIEANEEKIVMIPEGASYVYINAVGNSPNSPSAGTPTNFAFAKSFDGFNCIKRITDLEKGVKKNNDSYFDSNVVQYDINNVIGNTLIPINIPVDSSGHVIPQSVQELNVQLKAKQFCLIKWTCKKGVPYRHDTIDGEGTSSGAFEEGETITGMPYSSVKELDKYIGFEVSVLTFMTAVNNPYSLLYTENVSANHSKSDWGFVYHGVNCATYYGTVCSEFSSYATGMSIIIPTHGHKWLTEYAMKAVCLYNQTEDNLKIGDILVRYNKNTGSSMHCMVVVDIVRNGNGNVTSFVVAESTGESVRYTTRTKIAETNNTVIAYRHTELYKNIGYDDSANEFINLSLLPNPVYNKNATEVTTAQIPYDYNNDICTFAGDKACFAEGDLIVLNYNLNNDANFPYTDIEVYKDDVLLGTYNIASIDQSELPVTQQGHALKLGITLLPGDYKARCKNLNSESEYTYFEVIDTSHVTIENDFIKNRTTINFSSTNGLPVCVGMTNISGGQLVMRELTDGEVLSGEIKSDFIRLYEEQNNGKTLDDSVELWIKLYFKGKYGGVTAKLPYMNVEE